MSNPICEYNTVLATLTTLFVSPIDTTDGDYEIKKNEDCCQMKIYFFIITNKKYYIFFVERLFNDDQTN